MICATVVVLGVCYVRRRERAVDELRHSLRADAEEAVDAPYFVDAEREDLGDDDLDDDAMPSLYASPARGPPPAVPSTPLLGGGSPIYDKVLGAQPPDSAAPVQYEAFMAPVAP